jgi:cold shock CspA family protein
MKGVIFKLVLNRGFGFIRGDNGVAYFFHAREVIPTFAFDIMREGMAVEFISDICEKGPRAEKVRVDKSLELKAANARKLK